MPRKTQLWERRRWTDSDLEALRTLLHNHPRLNPFSWQKLLKKSSIYATVLRKLGKPQHHEFHEAVMTQVVPYINESNDVADITEDMEDNLPAIEYPTYNIGDIIPYKDPMEHLKDYIPELGSNTAKPKLRIKDSLRI